MATSIVPTNQAGVCWRCILTTTAMQNGRAPNTIRRHRVSGIHSLFAGRRRCHTWAGLVSASFIATISSLLKRLGTSPVLRIPFTSSKNASWTSCVSSNRKTVGLLQVCKSHKHTSAKLKTCYLLHIRYLHIRYPIAGTGYRSTDLLSAPAIVKTFLRSSRHSVMPYDLDISIWNSL